MKILLVIETPEDDDLHYPRIGSALTAYISLARHNNEFVHSGFPVLNQVGLDSGPNTMDFFGTKVTEQRIDALDFKFLIWDWLRNRSHLASRIWSAIAFH